MNASSPPPQHTTRQSSVAGQKKETAASSFKHQRYATTYAGQKNKTAASSFTHQRYANQAPPTHQRSNTFDRYMAEDDPGAEEYYKTTHSPLDKTHTATAASSSKHQRYATSFASQKKETAAPSFKHQRSATSLMATKASPPSSLTTFEKIQQEYKYPIPKQPTTTRSPPVQTQQFEPLMDHPSPPKTTQAPPPTNQAPPPTNQAPPQTRGQKNVAKPPHRSLTTAMLMKDPAYRQELEEAARMFFQKADQDGKMDPVVTRVGA
jgi:hypothetical protein